MNPIELRDILNYRYLSKVTYAPGGKRAAFVVTTCNENDNSYENRIWLYDGQLRQMTDIGKESNFLWEDEYHILFSANRSSADKKRAESGDRFSSWYRLDVRGGEAIHAFTLPMAGALRRLDQGTYLAMGSINVNHPDFYAMDEADRRKVLGEYRENRDYEVFDELPFWRNGGGYCNKTRSALFLVRDNGAQVRRVTAPNFSFRSYTVLGDYVFFAGDSYDVKCPVRGYELHRLNWRTGECALIKHDTSLQFNGMATVNGRVLAFATTGERFGFSENDWIHVMDPDTGDLTVLREEDYSMYSTVGSDCRYGGGAQISSAGKRLYHISTQGGNSHLCAVEEDGSSSLIISRDGSVDAFAVSDHSDQALVIGMFDSKLQELYRVDVNTLELEQLTHFNDQALQDKYVAEFHPIAVDSCGYNIKGWVLYPMDYDPRKTYPAVLAIHGGPKTVYGPVFYHEMQLWASNGYFVFFCNPKGSDGVAGEFVDTAGHLGEEDYENLMDFTSAVLEAYPQIDRTRLCVCGGSYGGFMTNWIIGHTDRFCCAVSQRSISNWVSHYCTSDTGIYFKVAETEEEHLQTQARLWNQSPLKYAYKVKTPTLFIHSDQDYRCFMDEGLQMYSALATRGVPTRLCLFHGENHGLSRSGKPKHRIRRLTEMLNWMNTYCK